MNKLHHFFCVAAACLIVFWGDAIAVAADERPNILIAISDDQSWPHTGIYGAAELATPAFDQVARSGALFHNAFAASPGCSPSRAALLTGQHTWQIREAGTHASAFPADLDVFPAVLRDAGYWVGFTGKGWGPGNWKISQRTENPAGPQFSSKKLALSPPGISRNDYSGNFAEFLAKKPAGQPFLFWYGATEPHRTYERDAGLQAGKNPDRVVVPHFLPDDPVIRRDLLDYYVEIEWFDRHLSQMLAKLAERGELDNTLVIVTADNGMPFPRAKANCYEYGIHVPLAISWPKAIPAGQNWQGPVGFVDLTATILAAANLHDSPITAASVGENLLPGLVGGTEPASSQDRVALAARERHSSSRYNNWTYPQRALRTADYLLIRNFRPERWPAGAPQKYDTEDVLGPLHGAYHDIDACPSLTFLIEHRDEPRIKPYFLAAVAKRPEYELFSLKSDPACLTNLAECDPYAEVFSDLKSRLAAILKETGDPRLHGTGDVYESYPRYSRIRKFPAPE